MRESTYKIALGGILSALALLFLFMGGVLPFAEYVGPVLASVTVSIFASEMGKKSALLMILTVDFLAIFLSSNMESAALFVGFLGWYPLLKPWFDKHLKQPVRFLVKQVFAATIILVLYTFLIRILGMEQLLEDFGGASLWMNLLNLFIANWTFYFYDLMLERFVLAYQLRFRKKFLP